MHLNVLLAFAFVSVVRGLPHRYGHHRHHQSYSVATTWTTEWTTVEVTTTVTVDPSPTPTASSVEVTASSVSSSVESSSVVSTSISTPATASPTTQNQPTAKPISTPSTQTQPTTTTIQSSTNTDFEQSILQPHNSLRATKGAQALTWDTSLAAYAQSYASKCVFQHSGGPNGENLAAGSEGYDNAGLIKLWSDEESSYNPQNPQPSHYTQMVWKGTSRIGCAVVECPAGTVFEDVKSVYMVCEYQSPGNVLGAFPENVEA